MRVLGIDPGSRHTGYGVVEAQGTSLRLLACGTLSPGDGLPLATRLASIHAGLVEVLRRTAPVAVAVEDVYHAVNARSALVLGQARGAALVAAAASSIEVHEYAASEIKRAVTGTGKAGKEQVGRMVAMLLGGTIPGDEHACDALAAAICHVNRSRLPLGASAPKAVEMLPAVVLPGGANAAARKGRSGFPAGVKLSPAVRRPETARGEDAAMVAEGRPGAGGRRR